MDPVVLDVTGLSFITDFYVVCSCTSAPHLKAVAAELENRLAKEGIRAARGSGVPQSGWLVLDFLDVVVHLFTPEMRTHYAIEQLWSDARPVR